MLQDSRQDATFPLQSFSAVDLRFCGVAQHLAVDIAGGLHAAVAPQQQTIEGQVAKACGRQGLITAAGTQLPHALAEVDEGRG